MAIHVLDETKRCLQCKHAACMRGCPIHTQIPQMIRLLQEERLSEAGKLLFENNPLALICSLVCEHEVLCEGACIWNDRNSPIQISSIEEYVADTFFERYEIPCEPSNGKMAAVIGSGPAGITIAIRLAQKGYRVTVFESRDRIGGVLRYGIPDFRLPKSILSRYKKKMMSIGIRFRPNTTIGGGALEIDDLFRDGYRSIYIGAGTWWPKTLGVRGESLGNVHFAIDYLANPEVYTLGEKLAIIGAGNAAVDVARTALRHGVREVTLYEIGPRAGATPVEISYAKMDGAYFLYGKKVVEIKEEGPVFRNLTYDAKGEVTAESEELEQVFADSTIIAISQKPRIRMFSKTKELQVSDEEMLVTDGWGTTTQEGIFASGDVVHGPRTIVEAVAHSKKVAEAMDAYMKTLP